ncbi:MAG: histidine phosphatase family protein [Clostridium sp.]|nr:histidine phosphatase family protein [Clostridium sp.]
MRRFFSIIAGIAVALVALAADPMATDYSFELCQGSLMPYPEDVRPAERPDTLRPVMINHVGRHGARYPASAANCMNMRKALNQADSLHTITPLGRKLMGVVDREIELSNGRWGALDSLGEAEHRGIASRMYMNFPEVFVNANVAAISSYSPRAMMSMYAFTHQLDRLNNRLEFITTTGRVNDRMMRPFDVDTDYIEFRKGPAVKDAYDSYFSQACPTSAIDRVLGKDYPYAGEAAKRELAITEYYVLAGLAAMSVECDLSQFFTREEINALWSCFNLRQYLQRTATTLSSVPADIAADLLEDLISTTDDYIAGKASATVFLRFGHAETLMPLLSLMRMPGCYYMTNYFDTVALHWKDFYVVPMAANLQMILFQSSTGRYYVRFDLNETPVPLIPNSQEIYIPWAQARHFLQACLPL